MDEKASGAVRTLAVGVDPIQVRVAHAYLDYLMHGIHNATDEGYLPEELLSRMQNLELRLAPGPAAGDDPVMASTAQMSDDEASAVAGEMVDFADEVGALFEEHPGSVSGGQPG